MCALTQAQEYDLSSFIKYDPGYTIPEEQIIQKVDPTTKTFWKRGGIEKDVCKKKRTTEFKRNPEYSIC